MFRYILAAAALIAAAAPLPAQQRPALNDREQAIASEIGHLRGLPDDQWKGEVGKLAREIQRLPQSAGKATLIGRLGDRVTEGDAGHATLQVVASTMADVLRTMPAARLSETLAMLVRYEHCEVSLDTPRYRAAMATLEAEDERRQNADFTLTGIAGESWSLKNLRGKVVLVNFWATWCPPCRKEMPDLETLYRRFGLRGLVILAISDEDASKVKPFIAAQHFTYPILLDPGRRVEKLFSIDSIPRTFVYNREGKLVAQGIDRRTEKQFLAMLRQAGL
jgi:peroxiredoxin